MWFLNYKLHTFLNFKYLDKKKASISVIDAHWGRYRRYLLFGGVNISYILIMYRKKKDIHFRQTFFNK
jgi:hypothetical protein